MNPSEPRPLSLGLGAVVNSLKGGDVRVVKGIFGTWAEAVGEMVAANARPVRFADGVLLVEVDENAWATQLRFLESEIRTRLAEVGGVSVERIEVRVKGAARSSRMGTQRRG